MKRMWKSGLAFVLAGVMALTPVWESAAANISTGSENDVIIVEDISEEDATETTETEEQQETVTEEATESDVETTPETETEFESEAESETETKTETETETEQESETEVLTEVETETVTVPEIETETESETETEDEDNWRGTGHKAPKLEMTMTSAMIDEKCELEGTAERLEELEENIEYVANEAVFLASSKEYAQQVAKGYGAVLISYEDGVAVISFEDKVAEIIAMAEDEEVKLPAVYPNYLYTSDSTEGIAGVQLDAATSQTKIPDPRLSEQSYHNVINTYAAWNYNNAAGKGIKVAVLDSGINKAHEDLKKRVTAASVTHSTAYNKSEDNDGQGTHVAGIIAANKDNGIGGAGIAYNATIISVKVLEENPLIPGEKISGSTADIVKAMNTSVASGARVINIGFAGQYYDILLENTVNKYVNKGVVIVAAVGDNALELSSDKTSNNYYSPACFENVITVSSMDTDTSNYGEGIVDITAPGSNILSSVPSKIYGKSYENMSGTAQASGMVSATAAYIFSVRPDLVSSKSKTTVDTIKKILQDSATQSGYEDSAKFGSGLLNVEAAIKMAAPSATNNTALQAPEIKIDGVKVTKNQTIQNTDKITLTSALGSTADENIKIYYTLNGKTPTEKSTLYTEPFSIEASGNKTIKAIAVYYGKKSSVTSLRVKVNAYAESFVITSKSGYNYLGAGKSLTLKVGSFVPSYTTKKNVEWEIVSGSEYASINSKGVLKAKTDITENCEVKVRATAADRKTVTAELVIKIVPKITVFRLSDKSNAKMKLKHSANTTVKVPIEVNLTDTSVVPIVCSSSNNKVATITSSISGSGVALAIKTVGSGNATLTVKTIDGSNKKITIKVNVTKAVESIIVRSNNGEYQLAAGNSLQMVADVTSDATNKKVSWSIADGSDVATISSKGVLTAKKDVEEITSVTVKATSQEDPLKEDTELVKIYPNSTKSVGLESGTSYKIGTVAKGDIRKSIQLYPYTEGYNSGSYGRRKSSGEVDFDKFTYTSSNPKVATVSATGVVTSVAEGTTKIKVVAKDGSKKSVTCTVKVVKPVTNMAIYSKSQTYFLGNGKSMNLGVIFYSGGTDKTVNWTSDNPNIATVDQKGKVTGVNYGAGEAKVTITATAADGSDTYATFPVVVKPAITKLAYAKENVTTGEVTYSSSSTMKMVLGTNIKESQIRPSYFDTTSGDEPRYEVNGEDVTAYWDASAVSYTCSNPNVIQIVKNADGETCIVAVNTGTAYITYKAVDGSGKSCKMKIQVVKQ